MVAMNNPTLEQFDRALEDWVDERFITRKELRTVAMFTMYLVNLATHDGWVYHGHSWKESEYLGCLVIKALKDDIPQVVFTSAKTYTDGIAIFLRKMEEDRLQWVPDKYRQ